MSAILQYICDDARHLICLPYTVENLHRMAQELSIRRCWFHAGPPRGSARYAHYDIPKRRIEEVKARCQVVTSKELVRLIRREVKVSETVEVKLPGVGDWVIHPRYPNLYWQVGRVLSEGSVKGWLKLLPFDPISRRVVGLVLTEEGQPVDYGPWVRQQVARWASYQDVDWNQWCEANGGTAKYEWHRPFTVPPSSVQLVDGPFTTSV